MPSLAARVRRSVQVGAVAAALGAADPAAAQMAPTSPTVPIPVLQPKASTYRQHDPRRLAVYADVPLPHVVAEPNADDEKKPAAQDAIELTLGECLAIAVDRQPSLRAVRASQSATQAGLAALQNIGRVGRLLRPDLPIREQQACRGVTAAAADVQKIYNEVVYDVTRLYYTAVYARQQEQVAADVVGTLEGLVKIAEDLLKSPMPGKMNQLKLSTMKIGLAEARRLKLTAQLGQRKALAALREAMGVCDASYPVRPKDGELPVMGSAVGLGKDGCIAFALERRPELALAAAGVDAFRLEVQAQGKVRIGRKVPTFAIGSDLHSHPVPQGDRGKDYRPGAIEPEMPTHLVGTQAERVTRAEFYSQRADAVFEKARNLVALDAENAFLDHELAAGIAAEAKVKNDEGQLLADLSRRSQENIPDKDALVQNELVAAKAKGDYIEALYQHLLSLAALERVTAGGVRPAFPGR